jgi:hypothetical protein
VTGRWICTPEHRWLVAELRASGKEDRLGDYDKVVSGLGDRSANLAFGGAHDGQEDERAEDNP